MDVEGSQLSQRGHPNRTISEQLAKDIELFLSKFSNEGFGPSDHAAFYAKDIPVLFISTGAHPDYHTPADDVESINLEGMQEVLNFVADVALALEADGAVGRLVGRSVGGQWLLLQLEAEKQAPSSGERVNYILSA